MGLASLVTTTSRDAIKVLSWVKPLFLQICSSQLPRYNIRQYSMVWGCWCYLMFILPCLVWLSTLIYCFLNVNVHYWLLVFWFVMTNQPLAIKIWWGNLKETLPSAKEVFLVEYGHHKTFLVVKYSIPWQNPLFWASIQS